MMLPSVADKGADVVKIVRPLLQRVAVARAAQHLLPLPGSLSRRRAQRFAAMNLVSGVGVAFASWLFVTLLRRRRILHI